MKCNVIIHGCPSGQQSNAEKNDPREFVNYIDRFHMGNSEYVPSPSRPSEKFIEEILPSGSLAYTFVRMGVREIRSDRPGSNYAAITLFFPSGTKILNEKDFQEKLKQWFESNVLARFTRNVGNDWLKWTDDAGYYIFDNHLDATFYDGLQSLFQYVSSGESKHVENLRPDMVNWATEQLKSEIQTLERQEKAIQQQLVQKRAELNNLTNKA